MSEKTWWLVLSNMMNYLVTFRKDSLLKSDWERETYFYFSGEKFQSLDQILTVLFERPHRTEIQVSQESVTLNKSVIHNSQKCCPNGMPHTK